MPHNDYGGAAFAVWGSGGSIPNQEPPIEDYNEDTMRWDPEIGKGLHPELPYPLFEMPNQLSN
jgi:hypothetical protein